MLTRFGDFRNLQDSNVFSMPYSTTYVCCDNEKVQATFHKHSTGGGIDPTTLNVLVVFYIYWQMWTAQYVSGSHYFFFPSVLVSFYHGATAPSGPRPPYDRGFMTTLRHTTLGRTPLDEWSALFRALDLTTHNTHRDRHPFPRRDSNPQSQQASVRRHTP